MGCKLEAGNMVLVMTDGVADTPYICSPIWSSPWLFYAIKVVEVEIAKNAISPANTKLSPIRINKLISFRFFLLEITRCFYTSHPPSVLVPASGVSTDFRAPSNCAIPSCPMLAA